MALKSSCLALFVAAACIAQVAATTPFWNTKAAAEWTSEDARQVLTSSPWARTISAGLARRLTESELREGGRMGQPPGVGNEGVDPKGSGPKISPNPFTGPGGNDRGTRALPGTITVRLVWETAPAVQLAEMKASTPIPPTMEGDGYKIAVYGVPGADFKDEPKKLGEPMKQTTFLKREGKKDVKPVDVEVFQQPGGSVAVVYLFPYSAEISEKDGEVDFEAQIGRISVAHTFVLKDMEFQGKLGL